MTRMASAATSDEPPVRSRPRRGAKAEVLIQAAHRLVVEHGEHFTTQDLIREADVGLQTLYRNFGGKDQLLVAVMADLIEAQCELLRQRAAVLDDPVDRLRTYVEDVLGLLSANPEGRVTAQFLSSQRWRLHQSFPEDVAAAMRPFAALIQRELELGNASGSLASPSPADDAVLISRLVMASFHHHLFAVEEDEAQEAAGRVWRFCLAAVGGRPPG